MEENKNIIIDFYKSAIVKEYSHNGKQTSMITFPKFSIYAGYVWHYPSEWIKNSQFEEDKRYISVKPEKTFIISRLEKDTDSVDKHMVVTNKLELTADRLKEAMRKQPKAETSDDIAKKGDQNEN